MGWEENEDIPHSTKERTIKKTCLCQMSIHSVGKDAGRNACLYVSPSLSHYTRCHYYFSNIISYLTALCVSLHFLQFLFKYPTHFFTLQNFLKIVNEFHHFRTFSHYFYSTIFFLYIKNQ